MNYSMEEIFGKGSLSSERLVSGLQASEREKVRYVSFNNKKEIPEKVFRAVIRKIDPPLMKAGGAILDGCILTTPSNISLFAIAFHDDLEGWQRQIEQGAIQSERFFGKIVEGILGISNGENFRVDECIIEFD